uniref:Uncharacterized protein n=1 Tax=Kwoniella bestiolae CBS 10118 TaxID=1296100 RepID=A0A1B9GEJ2_9TREE|nr:hypothetical protein I302_00951 [Kwoniella bestiolae CBS 10118]OCF29446.1 hypothetical protein I302_00951 [Kwoniella bestiolae CBS 10118]
MSLKKPVPSDIPLPSTPPPAYKALSERTSSHSQPLPIEKANTFPGHYSTAAEPSAPKPVKPVPILIAEKVGSKPNPKSKAKQPEAEQERYKHPPPPPPPRVFDWEELSKSRSHPPTLKVEIRPLPVSSAPAPTPNKLKKGSQSTPRLPLGVKFEDPPTTATKKKFHTPPITPPKTPTPPPTPPPDPVPSPDPLPERPSKDTVDSPPAPPPPPPPPLWTNYTLPWRVRREKMAAPPRMLILSGGGYEAFVAMPPSYEKAVALATEKFNIPNTHIIRLSCKASDMQWIGGYAGSEDIFIADNDSFHYACAGKHVARLGVHVYDKSAKPGPTPAAPAASGGGGGDKKEDKTETKPPPVPPTADQSLTCQTTAGKNVTLAAKVTGELAKGIPAGNYLGTLTIEDKTWKQTFVGNQLGPNENTARLLFRPRSIRPSVEFLPAEEKSLEVSLSIADWTVTSAYPMTSLLPDGARQKLRWFLKVQPGGIVEDMLTGTQSNGLFMEMIPSVKAKPDKEPDPDAPLIPAWPDIRPSNAWCLPQTIFIPHIDRILTALGLPVESRTAMITSWLPGLTRHKNIAYRILNRSQLDPCSTLTIIPPPSVMLRIFVLFKGIPDSEMKDWENAGVLHAEMGLDWRDSVGWTPDLQDESLFRVIEYGAMEVFE